MGSAAMKIFLAQQAANWLAPVLDPARKTENTGIIREVMEQATQFVSAVQRYHAHGCRKPKLESNLRHLDPELANEYSFNLDDPACLAHTDGHDVGLFSFPVGTIVVDHHGLNRQALRRPTSETGNTHVIPLSDISPSRLWQIGDGCFAAWHGDRHPNALYHVIPNPPQTVLRYRLFVEP